MADGSGVRKARSVRRIAAQDRWTEDTAKWIRNVPWHRYKDQHDADGDIPEEKVVESREPELEKLEPKMVIKTWEPIPRAFQIRKEDAEKHGYTRDCAGCEVWDGNRIRMCAEPGLWSC